MRKTLTIYQETFNLVEDLQREFKRMGMRYSKTFIIETAIKLLHSMVCGGQYEEVDELLKRLIDLSNVR